MEVHVPLHTGNFELCRDFLAKDSFGADMLRILEPKRYLFDSTKYWPYWAPTLDAIPAIRAALHDPTSFPSTPENFAMMGMFLAMEHDVPTYFLGKDLCQALLRTVPPNLPIDRLKLPFPTFRVVLEKGAYRLAGGAEFAAFLFGCRGEEGLSMPPQICREYSKAKEFFLLPKPTWFIHTSGVEPAAESAGKPPGSLEIFYSYFHASTSRIQNIQDLLPATIKDRFASDKLSDDPTVLHMSTLLINLALLLTARPEYVSAERLIRKGKVKGTRRTDDLWEPRVVGSGFKARRESTSDGLPNGVHQIGHWRAGHWKEQPYGPKSTLRKDIWVEPYSVNIQNINT